MKEVVEVEECKGLVEKMKWKVRSEKGNSRGNKCIVATPVVKEKQR